MEDLNGRVAEVTGGEPWDGSGDGVKRLFERSQREKKHSTRFVYSLEEFGLDPELIRKQLGDRFGWDDVAEERGLAKEKGTK